MGFYGLDVLVRLVFPPLPPHTPASFPPPKKKKLCGLIAEITSRRAGLFSVETSERGAAGRCGRRSLSSRSCERNQNPKRGVKINPYLAR